MFFLSSSERTTGLGVGWDPFGIVPILEEDMTAALISQRLDFDNGPDGLIVFLFGGLHDRPPRFAAILVLGLLVPRAALVLPSPFLQSFFEIKLVDSLQIAAELMWENCVITRRKNKADIFILLDHSGFRRFRSATARAAITTPTRHSVIIAIKGSKVTRSEADKDASDGLHPHLSSLSAAARTADSTSGPRALRRSGGSPSRGQCTRKAIAEAKGRFAAAVANGVDELMKWKGYSRDRASSLILQEIQQGVAYPTDEEVFRVMKMHGIGMEDASKTLLVARAVQRSRSEKGVSSVEAIDDLTLKLSTSRLFGQVGPDTAPIDSSMMVVLGDSADTHSDEVCCADVIETHDENHTVLSNAQLGAPVLAAAAPSNHIPSPKASYNNLKVKASSKAASVSSYKINSSSQHLTRNRSVVVVQDCGTSREPDSVKPLLIQGEPCDPLENMNVAIESKTKLPLEDGVEHLAISKSPPPVLRAKRVGPHRGDDQQPPTKRARAESL